MIEERVKRSYYKSIDLLRGSKKEIMKYPGTSKDRICYDYVWNSKEKKQTQESCICQRARRCWWCTTIYTISPPDFSTTGWTVAHTLPESHLKSKDRLFKVFLNCAPWAFSKGSEGHLASIGTMEKFVEYMSPGANSTGRWWKWVDKCPEPISLCGNHSGAHARNSSGSHQSHCTPIAHNNYQIIYKHSIGFSFFFLLPESTSNTQVALLSKEPKLRHRKSTFGRAAQSLTICSRTWGINNPIYLLLPSDILPVPLRNQKWKHLVDVVCRDQSPRAQRKTEKGRE